MYAYEYIPRNITFSGLPSPPHVVFIRSSILLASEGFIDKRAMLRSVEGMTIPIMNP